MVPDQHAGPQTRVTKTNGINPNHALKVDHELSEVSGAILASVMSEGTHVEITTARVVREREVVRSGARKGAVARTGAGTRWRAIDMLRMQTKK